MDAVRTVVAENIKGGDKIAKDGDKFSLEDVPAQDGKVAVVTGGSEGIGYACTYTLLKRNISKLYILSLSKDVVDSAFDAVAKDLGQSAAEKTTWLHCDLSDWKEVSDVASKIHSSTDRLDILINNSARGIMTAQRTHLDVDRHMALNHVGHALLTSHLLPLLKKTAEAGNTVRIGNMASNAHQGAPKEAKFESLEQINQDYGPIGQYGQSKLANILYSRYLNKHLTAKHPNILVNAAHPGFVRTKMSTEDVHEAYPLGGYGMSVGLAPFQKDQWEGGLSMMYIATATDKSGEYICPPAIVDPGTEQSRDETLAENLMKLTAEVVKEKLPDSSVGQGCPLHFY